MVQGTFGAFAVQIPVADWMRQQPNVRLFHIGLATPCSTVTQITLCSIYFVVLLCRERRERRLKCH